MKLFKLNLIALILFGLNFTMHSGDKTLEELKEQINPQNSAFVFDMHGVVVKFSWPQAFAAVHQMSFANKVHFTKKTLKYFCNNKNPKRAFEGVALEGKENDQAYVAQALAVMNPHVPNVEIVDLLQELKSQGYDIYGCSNIGQKSYDYLKAKYPEAFEAIIACRTSNPANNYMKKSDERAYQEMLELIIKSNKAYQYLLFVDDKQSNLDLASKVDARFKQILLKDPKKLRPNLANIGIL